MTLRLIREPSGVDNTFGVLFIDGYFQCFTLENSHQIIPKGIYNITLYNSPRFKYQVPLLNNVVARSMIEIHPANYFHELEGCIAVGEYFDTSLHKSNMAFTALMEHLKKQSIISIKIEDWYHETETITT